MTANCVLTSLWMSRFDLEPVCLDEASRITRVAAMRISAEAVTELRARE